MASKTRRNEYRILDDKILLYQRNDATEGKLPSDIWYAEFRLPGVKGRAKKLTLGTRDKTEAESFAQDRYFEISQKSRRGLSLNSTRFELVANAYLKDARKKTEIDLKFPEKDRTHLPNRLRAKTHTITNYLNPFFGNEVISDISDLDVDSYKHWRKEYWVTGPGAKKQYIEYQRDGKTVRRKKLPAEEKPPNSSTSNKELTILRDIFEYARLKKIIHSNEIPFIKNVKSSKKPNKRKPGLTGSEVKLLLDTLSAKMKAQTNPKHQRHQKLLICYIAFMCTTGLRTTEARKVKFKDCRNYPKDSKTYLKIHVWGKGKERELVALHECQQVLQGLKNLHKENAKIHGWVFDEGMPLFIDQYGKPIKSLLHGLNKALEDAKLLYDIYENKRNTGSFRKYYATTALMTGKVDPFTLAKQMGTSVAVIEAYYAEIGPTNTPEKFIFENALSGKRTA